MHKKFEIRLTKIKGSCQLGRKVVTHNSKSDLPLARIACLSGVTSRVRGGIPYGTGLRARGDGYRTALEARPFHAAFSFESTTKGRVHFESVFHKILACVLDPRRLGLPKVRAHLRDFH